MRKAIEELVKNVELKRQEERRENIIQGFLQEIRQIR